MPTLIQVAIWNVGTEVTFPGSRLTPLTFTGHLSQQDRYRLLKDVVAEAVSQFPPVPQGTAHLRMFLAPEYMFARGTDKHILHPTEQGHVIELLQKLSARHPDILFFPGTVAYCKPLLEYDKTGQTVTKNRTVKYANVVSLDRYHPKYMFAAHNTAYVFHNGAKIFKYRKASDAGEINPNESLDGRMVFVPGTGPATFTAPGNALQVGLEVCADHAGGTLSRDHGNLDIHVLLSASTVFQERYAAVREGGIVCHADAVNAPAVYQKVMGQMTPVALVGNVTRINPKANPKVAPAVKGADGQFRNQATTTYAVLTEPTRSNSIQNSVAHYKSIRGGKLGVFEATI